MNKGKKLSLRSETLTTMVFVLMLVIISLVFYSFKHVFLSPGNLLMLSKHLSITALVALGLTFVITVGFADMSFHYVSCLSGMTMSYMIALGLHPVPSILIGCAAGVLCGVVSGLMVGLFKLPDMVATIGVGSVAFGLAYLYSKGSHIFENFASSGITNLNDGKLLGIPLPAIIAFVGYILGYLALHRTKFGRRFYATGSNTTAANFSGIATAAYVVAAFVICAVLASLTNMIQIAAETKGNVKGGIILLMPAYASVFVGVSIFKKPTVYGTFLGALLIGLMQNGFTLLSVRFYLMNLIVGAVLIIAIILSKTDFLEIARKRRWKAGNIDNG